MSETTPTREEIIAGRIAADEAWKQWTGGRSELDGMEIFVRAALEAAAKVREDAKPWRCGICGKTPCDGHGHHFIPEGEV